jgi:transcriptional regulator with XRE-family HTH domain
MSGRRLLRIGYVTDLIPDHVSDLRYPPEMPAEDEPLRRFGEAVRNARDAIDWSQDDLAEAAGVTRLTVSRYERGEVKAPDAAAAIRIFRALRLDPRLVPVLLGYSTEQEMGLASQPARQFDDLTETAIRMLEDPSVPADEKAEWLEYIRFRLQRLRRLHRDAS